ncbi:phosphoadenylyl-sulfate reductase [Candidatus Blochmannia vicinus]|uniref:Phosphoadenosine 5'-phosphosulfate reductase n=1 Tax=Candidatus Blochmannia vicinus (nom. nud.) TaxID=251540 RepID=A0A9Q8TVI8_9ENTR|nr:phosphoadenylyl-sulfate reductase [Candidatus Blochmannia vicinus]URJ28019.1 phosphoadenylyl-sulfate reductase [Candidatus Blochmannia vicinus]URJ32853.1 phosphoadenylyl-sulfate reductase [Candidatus Blochmannia vicinus]
MNKLLNIINYCWAFKKLNSFNINEQKLILNKINQHLESLTTEDRFKWAVEHLPSQAILSSSFGIQSSVSLHLTTYYYPNIPIILIDTGYLFPETYRFIDQLTEKMQLNLHVFSPKQSAAWQEARYGKLWEQGINGIKQYNNINKVEPMHRALKTLKVQTWVAGLRRNQSSSRKKLPIIAIQNGIFKFLPIIDWDTSQIYRYMKKHSLEYHPLWKQGYVSIGDIHTSIKWKPGMKEEETRFFGLQRECGLHIID